MHIHDMLQPTSIYITQQKENKIIHNKKQHELKELYEKRIKQASYKYAYLEAFTNPVQLLRT
jgi:hypothetical protein